jgi:exosortase/archaeosortase family protein
LVYSPNINYLLKLIIAVGLFYLALNITDNLVAFITWYSERLVHLIGGILHFVDPKIEYLGTKIVKQDIGIDVKLGCDGIEPIYYLATSIGLYLGTWKKKLIHIALGSIFLVLINAVRIVALFYISLYFPNQMDIWHNDILPILFLLIVFLLWLNYHFSLGNEDEL